MILIFPNDELLNQLAQMSPEDKTKHENAIRQAKVIVGDIKLYHGELVTKAIEHNALVKMVGPFIKDSYKIYKQRVPQEIVDSTNYFKDALNEFLCDGKKVF